MASTTRSTRRLKKKEAAVTPEKIRTAYQEYVLTNGRRPNSVFQFAQSLGIAESDFYARFGSFQGLERAIWKDLFDQTLQRLTADEAYTGFSSREKLLAFYYTLFSELESMRSFVVFQLEGVRRRATVPGFLRDFKSAFESYAGDILTTGRGRGEVANRPYIERSYPRFFWLQTVFLLLFWKDDDSAAFEQTDAAIEKSVNLLFDLIGKGIVDSAFDFARFLFRTKADWPNRATT